MTRTIIDVPLTWFGIEAMDDWHLDIRSKGGASGVTGTGQIIYGALPRYLVNISLPDMIEERLRAWRVVTAKMQGRLNVWRVRMNDMFEPAENNGATLFSDGATFSDGSSFSALTTAPILANAAAGATQINVDGSYFSNTIDGGQFISISDWPYQVIAADGVDASMLITLGRPLQRALTTADEINLNPTALVVFETDMEGRLGRSAPAFGKASASLIEWVGSDRP